MTGRREALARTVRPVWTAAALATVLCADVLAPARADELSPDEIDPYVLVVYEPESVQVFTDPTLDPDEVRTPGLSYPALVRELTDSARSDPRLVVPEAEIIRAADAEAYDYRELLAAQIVRDEGIENFGRYELETAIDRLEQALRLYARADAERVDSRGVATVYEYLARAYLERERVRDIQDPSRAVQDARRAFKEMIRLNPNAPIRPGLYPPVVVELFRRAYLELLLDNGAELELTASAASRAAERYGADFLAYPIFIRDGEGVRLVLRIYDAEGERVFGEAVVPLTPDTETSRERVNRVMSQFRACLPVREATEPAPSDDTDQGWVFIQAGWGAAVYGEKPTHEQFLNQGVGLTVDYHLTENLAVFLRTNALFGSRDSRGDLLEGFSSFRTALGGAFSLRFGWLRLFLGLGAEFNRVEGFRATNDFWCKVTGGDFGRFGADQDCLPNIEVTAQDARVLIGPFVMPGGAVDVVGPFAGYFLVNFAFYVTETTDLDFPIAAEAGIEYRFH